MSSMPGLPPHPYVPPPPPRRNYLAGCMLFAAGTFAVVTVLVGVAGWLLRGDAPGLPTFSQRIGVVELEGEIDDTRDLVEQLDRYGDDSSVRAVVLRINSPGGAVAPSQEMLEAVRRLRDKEKPVVVSMGEVCASGGYYIASGADTIFANPGTLTASIGVIWSFPTAEDLLKKVGVRWEIVKSGKVKDVGSPFQSLKPEGRAVLQALSDDTYEQFVDDVAEERGLDREAVLAIADGRPMTGRQALEAGLVDRMGDFHAAIACAAAMAKIEGKPTLVRKNERSNPLMDLLQRFADPGNSSSRLFHFRPNLRLEYRLF